MSILACANFPKCPRTTYRGATGLARIERMAFFCNARKGKALPRSFGLLWGWKKASQYYQTLYYNENVSHNKVALSLSSFSIHNFRSVYNFLQLF